MKRSHVILLAIILLAAALCLRREGHRFGVQPPPRVTRTNSAVLRVKRPVRHYDTPWQAWNVKDYRAFIEMMRASGCPEETIQDLVLMQLAREYQAQVVALEEARHMNPEWWHSDETHASAVEGARSRRQLQLEMAARIHDLLGVEFRSLLSRYQPFDYHPETWISPERNLKLQVLLDQFRNESTEIRLGPQGWWGPLDQDQKNQLADLEKSQRAELAAFLTPTELEAYDVRQSDAARYVRDHLPPANSEAEFRLMVKITQETGIPTKPTADSRDLEYAAQVQAEAAQQAALQRQIDVALGSQAVAAQLAAAHSRDQAEAERQAKVKAENDAIEEQQWQGTFADTAREVGIDPALAQALFDQFRALAKEREANPALTNIDDAMAEQIAVNVMGEKGHQFVRKIEEKSRHH